MFKTAQDFLFSSIIHWVEYFYDIIFSPLFFILYKKLITHSSLGTRSDFPKQLSR